MLDFIERLRAKPEHVRRRIAVTSATAITGVITLGWFAALVAGNTIMLDQPVEGTPTLAGSAQEMTASVENARASWQAAFNTTGEESESLQIIEGETKSTVQTNTDVVDDRQSIPF